jgi:hypothetical protein
MKRQFSEALRGSPRGKPQYTLSPHSSDSTGRMVRSIHGPSGSITEIGRGHRRHTNRHHYAEGIRGDIRKVVYIWRWPLVNYFHRAAALAIFQNRRIACILLAAPLG